MTRTTLRPCIGHMIWKRSILRINGRQKPMFAYRNGLRQSSSTSNNNNNSTNPAMTFPCLDKLEHKSRTLETGPEPSYSRILTGYKLFKSRQELYLDYGGVLSEFDIAYETWGRMNKEKSNVILIHTGLSASSHAKSHAGNPTPGWWEKFIGPGAPLDTNRFFIICTNVIGSCYGSTGPSSIDPSDGRRYATRFPVISVDDMIRAQARLIKEEFEISKLYASVGSSMGGMQSLSMAVHHPDLVGRVVSISGCALSHPYSIALRHTQRQVLMADRNWRRGFYYDDGIPPYIGMKLAREIATVTYRSGPEWEERFGRVRADPSKPPALCPDFLIETYLDHQGEKFCTEYDANSLLYVSKAMDLFDLSKSTQEGLRKARINNQEMRKVDRVSQDTSQPSCSLPDEAYEEQPGSIGNTETAEERDADLIAGLTPMADIPTFVLGVQSDFLFPSWQQQQVADCLVRAGNRNVRHVELGLDVSLYGHDTFLLSLQHVGTPLKEFLEKSL